MLIECDIRIALRFTLSIFSLKLNIGHVNDNQLNNSWKICVTSETKIKDKLAISNVNTHTHTHTYTHTHTEKRIYIYIYIYIYIERERERKRAREKERKKKRKKERKKERVHFLCQRIWTRWFTFKSWMRQFEFHITLISLGKECIRLFFLGCTYIVGQTWTFYFVMATKFEEGKLWKFV